MPEVAKQIHNIEERIDRHIECIKDGDEYIGRKIGGERDNHYR